MTSNSNTNANSLPILASMLISLTSNPGTNAIALQCMAATALVTNIARYNPDSRNYCTTLAEYSAAFPQAKNLQKYALSSLLWEINPPSYELSTGIKKSELKTQAADICSNMDFESLAEALKWPMCNNEAQQLVLNQLGTKRKLDFHGDVWAFVNQAGGLGITNLSQPPTWPSITDVTGELQGTRRANAPAGD